MVKSITCVVTCNGERFAAVFESFADMAIWLNDKAVMFGFEQVTAEITCNMVK